MGKPAIKFHLFAKPVGIGPEHWPSFWQFSNAYNPGGYPPQEFNWDATQLEYRWQRIGHDGIPDEDAPATDNLDAIRRRARALADSDTLYSFTFEVFWDHGECACTREFNEACPVHYMEDDEDGEEYCCRVTKP